MGPPFAQLCVPGVMEIFRASQQKKDADIRDIRGIQEENSWHKRTNWKITGYLGSSIPKCAVIHGLSNSLTLDFVFVFVDY